MSAITSIETRGLMEAYAAVYDQDLREELEEEREVEWVSFQIIENAAYVLFSQGYDVDDVISYFTEASQEVITEDAIAISEGVLLVESVAVSDEYIAEQFQLLYEKASVVKAFQGFIGGAVNKAGQFIKGAQKQATAIDRAKNIQKIRNAKTAVPPGSAPVTTGSGGKPPTQTAKITTTGGDPVGRNVFQKAGDFAKTQLRKLPGARTAQKFAQSGAGKLLGKVGSRVLPGLGVATYGMDAIDRAKKGDWGGAALSGIGAGLSAIPGVGLVAGLAPTAIQMATDAAGLTGDKSKKGSAKTAPSGPPSLKAKQDYAKSKGKYFASSDEKTYKNYKDAEAAKNSRRGVKPTPTPTPTPTPAASSSPAPAASSSAAPSSTPTKSKAASTKPASTPDTKLTPMQQWAAKNPTLADKVKSGQSGYDEISAKRDKPGPNEKQDQTPTSGPTPAIPDLKSVNADLKKANTPDALNKPAPANSALAKEQERMKREAEKAGKEAQAQTVNASYEYDAYDLVLEYLLSQGHTDTVEEAHYVMMEMDAETIGTIVEAAADQSDNQIDKGVKTTYKAGNTIDNQHQGRSRGLSRLPANERAAKTKRMQGRLNARRDDLFGERNKREDSRRDELKKMLGL